MSAGGTISALVVDDEPLARARLRELIGTVPWLRQAGEAATGPEAIEAIDGLRPDLVFLDVQLPGETGVDVLGRVRHRPAIIFTTAHDRFAVIAFELGAIDYLLKPFGRERFGRAVERARPLLEARAGAGVSERARDLLAGGPLHRLFVRDGGRIVPIALASVERLQACDDFVLVHTEGRVFRLNVALGDLEQRLDPHLFLRVHRSHLINLDQVVSFQPTEDARIQITLRSGTTLMASRQRSRELRALGR